MGQLFAHAECRTIVRIEAAVEGARTAIVGGMVGGTYGGPILVVPSPWFTGPAGRSTLKGTGNMLLVGDLLLGRFVGAVAVKTVGGARVAMEVGVDVVLLFLFFVDFRPPCTRWWWTTSLGL